ncbi:MAG: tripartite tricarboxylate transporter substrate binding protein [Inquilinus sp.]|nr:tripartite tricarboxylate transporter substrate binding protein [Inquilinus sp.]
MRILRTLLTAVAAVAVIGAPVAQAEFPEKPMNFIVAFNPGGETDVTARLQQPYYEKVAGQPLVIQYKPGAGGAQAWAGLNELPGDGYTMVGTNLPHIILQPMEKDVGYETADITNVYMFHYTPDAVLVPQDSPFQTLADLVAYAKSTPGAVTLSGSGTNTANHLAQRRFSEMAGITTTYVPFGGTGPSVTAVLGNQVSGAMGYSTVGVAQEGQLRMLAVATDQRLPRFPDVPTFKELGYDLVSGAYRGIAVPKSTSEEVRHQVSDIIGRINADPDFIQQMEDGGFVVIDVPYDEVPAFMAAKQSEYGELADAMGIRKR